MRNLLFLLMIVCLVPACATFSNLPFQKKTLIEMNHSAGESLAETLVLNNVDLRSPIIVSTVVNIDKINESSRLGRLITEHVSSSFANSGFNVTELKLRENIFVKENQGELLLSREAKEIMKNHKAQAVVVGTYSESDDFVYVSLKVVRVSDNTIIAAHDYSIPLNENIETMLRCMPKKKSADIDVYKL